MVTGVRCASRRLRSAGLLAGIVAAGVLFSSPGGWADGKGDLARGVAAEAAQNYDLALRYYDAAIQAQDLPRTSLAFALFNRANIYVRLKRYPSAVRDYSRAVDLLPDFAEAYSNRGLVFAKMKSYDQAIEDFNMAISLDQSNARDYVNRGNLYESLRQMDLAVQDWKTAYGLGYRPAWLVDKLKDQNAL